MSENETIALLSVKYLEALDDLIGKTPNRVLKNFMVWRIVDTFSELLGAEKEYRNDTRPRTTRCFNFAAYNLHLSSNANWVRRFVMQKTKNEVTKIIESIKREFKETLSKLEWLDEETKRRALSKLEKMTPIVAYPDELLNDTILHKIYENISIDELKFFETVLELNKYYLYTIFKDLHKPNDRNNWESHSQVSVVNAFFAPPENTIRKFFFKLSKSNFLLALALFGK